MPRPRFNKLPSEKREQIIEAAAKAFVVHGYEDASLNHILEEAGVSKGAAYYYFDDKADLFATVVDHYTTRMLSEAAIDLDSLSAETFWPTLMDFYNHIFARLPQEPWLMMVWKVSTRLSQEARLNPLLDDVFSRSFDWFLTFLKRGQALGAVRTDLPDDLLFALFRGIDTAGDQWLLAHWEALAPERAQAIMLRIFDALRRLLVP